MQRRTADEHILAELVLRESDRLSRLLSGFLDFARVSPGEARPLDLSSVVRVAADLAGAHPDRPEGVVISCVLPSVALQVRGDEDLLHRAIFNLALNALQASPVGKQVTIELIEDAAQWTRGAGVPQELAFPGAAIGIRVSDCGGGIPASARSRLFDPFFTTRPSGSGLGLAVVHRAVEAHRGAVLVDSDEGGGGTRFTILLPNPREAAVASSRGAS
jgi:two-component system sensor histidine kinase PilS (NtrC family)